MEKAIQKSLSKKVSRAKQTKGKRKEHSTLPRALQTQCGFQREAKEIMANILRSENPSMASFKSQTIPETLQRAFTVNAF